MKAILSPSLLSADFACLGKELEALEAAGVSWLHLDVMDGVFVPNITFGAPLIATLRKGSNLFFDVHLMIEEPGRYLDAFAKAGANLLVTHIEADTHPQKTMAAIREFGIKAGIALNPDTDPGGLRWLLPYLDLVMLMGVNPGFSGQKFIPETIEKTRYCREFLIANGKPALPLEVDGGVTPDNAPDLAGAGATILVSGSAFFKGGDYAAASKRFAGAIACVNPDSNSLMAVETATSWQAAR